MRDGLELSATVLAKRVIACLDVADGRVVKGRNFRSLRDSGDPVERGCAYAIDGADEIVFLDIEATPLRRSTLVSLVASVARELFIPFTVGGGVATIADFHALLRAGADKVSIQTAAVASPELVSDAAAEFGSQCVIVAVDVERHRGGWEVFTRGGRDRTGIDALGFVQEIAERGAGELLVTSIDADGTRAGYDIELTRAISELVNIPVIASGGAGSADDIVEVLTTGCADAALAASIFHDKQYSIGEVKARLLEAGVAVRIC